jgi:GH25 family lysozyme M1 (1,4-beta-N-acetylmuramidase)
MSRTIIDLSVWNSGSTINWNVLKENVDGVIIRVGYRGYGKLGTLKTDIDFRGYANNCVKYNIPFGVYWFAQEINENESRESAQYIDNILKDYKLNYPVYYDVEYSGAKNNTGRADVLKKQRRTSCIVAFCDEIEKLGYTAGVYANEDWFDKMINYDKIKKYSIWCAKWGINNGKPEIPPKIQYNMWQYTSKGKISGINKHVDVSLDLDALINNTNIGKSINDLALEVISGKWGNGNNRKKALTSCGYDYNVVQKAVNEILLKK